MILVRILSIKSDFRTCFSAVFLFNFFLLSSAFAESVITWQGSWQQGGLLMGQIKPEYRVSFAGEQIKTTADGRFLFGLGRNAQGPSTFIVSSPNGTAIEAQYPVAEREYKIQRVEGVPQQTVKPPTEQLQRIRSDSALVVKARREVTSVTDFLEGFIKPIDGLVTGVYGSQRFYNGVPKSPHYGVDYAAPIGANVIAPAAGVVRLAHRDLFYSGGTLIIDHGHGLSSSFLHLSDILVMEGSRVERGDSIALVGSTGRSTGPHLDWRMNWRNVRVDPELVLEALPAQ
jgi:murein DD-endopeptidase MepM/ murein hydrolase activator NlpD